MDRNDELRAAYLEVVENQLRDNDPPETRKTYDRLCTEGFTENNAKVLIASVIAFETYKIMLTNSSFNRERFVGNLNKLPDQSFEEQ
jgi:hypothetical protein